MYRFGHILVRHQLTSGRGSSDCYKGVVDGHAAEIDNLRKRNGGIQLAPPTLKAKTAFDDFRANRSSTGRASTQLCAELSLASSNFGGTLQQLEDAGCVVDVEQDLARLVLSEADVPGGNVPLTATASDAEIAEFVDRIVAQIERNIAGTDEAKAKAELEGVIAGYKQAATDLCSVLEDAGQSGGGTMEPVLVASCLDKARGLLAIELKMVAAAADLAASQ